MATTQQREHLIDGSSPLAIMTIVKICGIRTAEHALVAATAGANLLGIIFAPSKRQVQPAEAATIVAALRQQVSAAQVRVVGVFVNESPAVMDAIASEVGLDMIQLSGDETPEQAATLHTPWIKALRLDGSELEQEWLAQPTAQPFLIDAHVPGAYGGSGQVADWTRAAEVAAQRPILLAGGLTTANVSAAVERVRPWGVDVSSGVETDGVKDSAKITAFISAVRELAS